MLCVLIAETMVPTAWTTWHAQSCDSTLWTITDRTGCSLVYQCSVI